MVASGVASQPEFGERGFFFQLLNVKTAACPPAIVEQSDSQEKG